MKIVNLTQGSPEWHAHRAEHFNASDAPAMMGTSKFETRSEFIHRLATGETKEIPPHLQRIFDDGHATEAQARPIVEDLIGDELFPVVGVSDEHPRLSASFDGVTDPLETGYEHKRWNEELAEQVRTGAIADNPAYWPQLEQQILVGGLKRVIFVVSDGTAEKMETFTYTPREGRATQLIAGWKQLEADLAAYKPAVAKAEVVAAPVETLPAIVYKRNGLELTSNIDQYRAAATALIERTKSPLVNDQDFADREALCKSFGEAEKRIDLLCGQVVGEIKDVAEFERGLRDVAAMFRAARIASEKLIDAEKKNRRAAIQQGGEQALAMHVAKLQARFSGRVTMPAIRGDFAGVIKGKRTLASIQDATDTELAQRKIEANAVADAIDANLRALDELAPEHLFLFRDLQQLITMPAEAFRATVEGRVATHKTKEAEKLAAETTRIERETRERLEREAEAKKTQQQASTVATAVKAGDLPAADPAPATVVPTVISEQVADIVAASPVTTSPTAGMGEYAKLRRQDEEPSPGVIGMANTLARSYEVDLTTALRWLQTINLAELADALKSITEAQEA